MHNWLARGTRRATFGNLLNTAHAARASNCTLLSAWCLAVCAAVCQAGGGPENVLVVVNQNSDNSKWVANEYISARRIPATNVLYVDYTGDLVVCKSDVVRTTILQPVLEAIDARKLSAQIDYVAYSADLPTRVDCTGDYQQKMPPGFAAQASLTGFTFLYRYAMTKSPRLVSPVSNHYMAGVPGANVAQCKQLGNAPSQGFRSRYSWNEGGKKLDDPQGGERYLLSTMLGVTAGRGMQAEEVVRSVVRSSQLDGTQPEGTFYFVKNSNVRSTTRDACYSEAVALLKAAGANAVVLDGVLPDGRRDVLGLTMGASSFDLGESGVSMQPGALCDNLTSSGGDFASQYQVPLTDFIEAGAAGASGTVYEPRAIQAKFPLPSLHVHYRRGCSLAEAFYQSISCPYQLLVVGDPLCQPWARLPRVEIGKLDSSQPVSERLTITHSVLAPEGSKVSRTELYVDGRLVARLPAGTPIPLNTDTLAPGHHEVRIVAALDNAVESQGSATATFVVADRDGSATPQLALEPTPVVGFGQNLVARLAAAAPGQGVEIRQGLRVVATIAEGQQQTTIATSDLGRGPTTLQAVATATGATSPPAWCVVK